MEGYNIGYLFGGVALLAIGTAIVVYHQKIADNFAGGVSSYNKVKLAGLGVCLLGIIFISNLHVFIIRAIFHLLFPNMF
ncbi:hypothetical protein IKQ74_03940 [Candidatus Saccharibacteria bacterium]|nr:hypothetical protein [Candidatus Saccharibacteria bacterium]